jgi:adenosylmethionine-8-amino-7-oxononanoate aminotransferase
MFCLVVLHTTTIDSRSLMEICQKPTKIFFSDNGSTAVEVAIKVALQYFFNKGQKKTTIIAFENAFHGDTLDMAASGISFVEAFQGMFIDIVRFRSVNRNRKGFDAYNL